MKVSNNESIDNCQKVLVSNLTLILAILCESIWQSNHCLHTPLRLYAYYSSNLLLYATWQTREVIPMFFKVLHLHGYFSLTCMAQYRSLMKKSEINERKALMKLIKLISYHAFYYYFLLLNLWRLLTHKPSLNSTYYNWYDICLIYQVGKERNLYVYLDG